MKKKILFVYSEMMMGGSTTSLLSLLNNFDYEKYDVDLLLYKNKGPFLKCIPSQVNLLPQAYVEQSKVKKVLKTVFNGTLLKAYYHGLKYRKEFKPHLQTMAYAHVSFCRQIEQTYDVAIGFLELWSDVFVSKCVQAKKKICWVHTDYEKAKFIPKIDAQMYGRVDNIVLVSQECLANFTKAFPDIKEKCVCVENILTKNFLLQRIKNELVDKVVFQSHLNLVTCCRIAIDTKGLDRAINVLSRLKKEGTNIKWYIIGSGADRTKLELLIQKAHLNNDVILLGSKETPYAYYDQFDFFFLPSRYEGKPMSVTEAQMLGLPPIVTNYSSAKEQVNDGIDGIIAENSEEGIYQAIKKVYKNRHLKDQFKEQLLKTNYDNVEEIEKILSLL